MVVEASAKSWVALVHSVARMGYSAEAMASSVAEEVLVVAAEVSAATVAAEVHSAVWVELAAVAKDLVARVVQVVNLAV